MSSAKIASFLFLRDKPNKLTISKYLYFISFLDEQHNNLSARQNPNHTNVNSFCTLNRKDRPKYPPNTVIHNQVHPPPIAAKTHQTLYQAPLLTTSARKSISMESIPSNINQQEESKIHQMNMHQQQQKSRAENIMQSSTIVHGNINNSSNYQKFGTVAGYTQVHHSRPTIDMQNTFNPAGRNEDLASEAAAAAQALANNRMRAINRSFRRAVDKSFDVTVPISTTNPGSGKLNLKKKYLILYPFLKND